ncbi:YezD family protein [Anaerospora hongkongensis]|uniref:YezD family protein n=1 Tax=Anaerospora hongkongensis TaxID=244830 RepID=UPI00289E90DB|nr:YezD family protein [Anaerospora hongkongensis]
MEKKSKADSAASNKNSKQSGELQKMILEAVGGLKYGQVVFVIKNGKVVQVERTDKSRITGLEGIYGDGI